MRTTDARNILHDKHPRNRDNHRHRSGECGRIADSGFDRQGDSLPDRKQERDGMSGTMMPQAAPQAAPQGAPQIPPQMIQQMLMQRAAQQGGGAPSPAMPPGMAPFAAAAQATPGAPAMGGPRPMGGAPQGPAAGPPAMTAQQMGSAGRLGDTLVAHLTPGEITIPPELQTPEVLSVLRKAFQRAGIPPQQFVAGSPTSSHNPVTGAEEHSLWSAILPIAGAIGGSFIPGLGTALGASLGGALGGAGGSLIDHGNFAQTALATLGGGAGGYLGAGGGLGSLFGKGAAEAAADSAFGAGTAGAASDAAMGQMMAGGVGAAGASPFAAASPTLGSILKTGMGASLGSGLAASLAPGSTASALPPGFSNHMPPLNPNFNALRGSTQGSTPNFN